MGLSNLPPGCTDADIERAAGWGDICEVCGNEVDSCICPECPVCEEVGNPNCYKKHGLVKTQEQILSLAFAEACEEDAAREEAKECNGHPAGPGDQMGQTVYCDGSCRD